MGVGVGAEAANGELTVGGSFDLGAGKSSAAVGIDEEGQKSGRGILFVAGATMVDLVAGGVDRHDASIRKWTKCPGGTQSCRSAGRSIRAARSMVTNFFPY